MGQIMLLTTNRKSHTAIPLLNLYLTLPHAKGQGQGHANTVNNSQMVTDKANIATANKYKIMQVLSIRTFTFDLAHSNVQ